MQLGLEKDKSEGVQVNRNRNFRMYAQLLPVPVVGGRRPDAAYQAKGVIVHVWKALKKERMLCFFLRFFTDKETIKAFQHFQTFGKQFIIGASKDLYRRISPLLEKRMCLGGKTGFAFQGHAMDAGCITGQA
jgi:hypothetical protein